MGDKLSVFQAPESLLAITAGHRLGFPAIFGDFNLYASSVRILLLLLLEWHYILVLKSFLFRTRQE
jgi:hypothetical protein